MAKTTARTEDEILDELHALDDDRQAIRRRMLALNVELTDARARATFDAMGEGERAAILRVAGIPSAEAVS